MRWTDASNYTHGQRGVVKPSVWETRVAGARIRVTCNDLYCRPAWVLHCDRLSLKGVPLDVPEGPEGGEKAKRKALEVCAEVADVKATHMSFLRSEILEKLNV